MDTVLKRVLAYIIDIFIVSIVASIILLIPGINKYQDEYNEAYETYLSSVSSEGSNQLTESESKQLTYDLNKYGTISTVVNISLTLIYFVIIQDKLKGQTLGKKLMKLQVVSNSDKKINMLNYLIRAIILCSIIFNIVNIILVHLLNYNSYYNSYMVLSIVQEFVSVVICLMVVLRSDGRGVHDMLSGTKVIDLNPVVKEEEPTEEVKPVKSSIKEKAERVTKRKSNKKIVK